MCLMALSGTFSGAVLTALNKKKSSGLIAYTADSIVVTTALLVTLGSVAGFVYTGPRMVAEGVTDVVLGQAAAMKERPPTTPTF